MSIDIKIEIPTSLRDEIQNIGNQIAKGIAIAVRDELTREGKIAIQNFYNSYSPTVYKRKWELENTCKPYYANSHGTRFHGGVMLSPDGLSNTYHDSPSEVFATSIMQGFHGRPQLGIFTAPSVYEHVLRYRDILYANIEGIAGGVIGSVTTSSWVYK